MRTVLGKFVKEDLYTYFVFNIVYLKMVKFLRQTVKLWLSQRGQRQQYNTADTHYMLDK
jgi:hypothetical protein